MDIMDGQEYSLAFRERYPRVDLELHQGTSEQIAELVSTNKVDFAIATGSRHLFTQLTLLPIYDWYRIVLVPQDHPLAQSQSPLELKTLADYPLVTYLFSLTGESSFKRAFREQGLEPPAYPMLFSKFANAVTDPGDTPLRRAQILTEEEVRTAILHARQDVKLVAFMLGGILIMLGIIDIEGVRMFFSTGLVRMVLLTILIGVGAYMLLSTDLLLGLLSLSFVPFVAWRSSVTQPLSRRMRSNAATALRNSASREPSPSRRANNVTSDMNCCACGT